MQANSSSKKLITPSLWNAYYWYAERAYGEKEDFLRVLRKEETEPKPIMLQGIKFENDIRDITEGKIADKETPEGRIADIVRGGFWQERVKKEFGNYILYGICDVIKDDKIYDIKFCNVYEDGKYNHSIQHLIYMYCTGIKKFEYLISEGRDVYIEPHSWNDESIDELKAKVFDCIEFIYGNEEFAKAYEENWIAR